MINTLEDVTSPSDWPENLPELRNIDNLLRCSICKEFFDVAVLIQDCAHNYCSLCIRQSINHKTQCPTCSSKVSCNDLKCNKVLDELVVNFVKVRSRLLELLSSKKTNITIKEKKDEKSDCDSEDMFVAFTPRGKNTIQKRKPSKGKSPKVRKRKRPKVESDSDDSDYDAVNVTVKQECHTPSRKTDPVKTTAATPCIIEKPSSSGAVGQGQPTDSVSSFVECPVCGDMIDSKTINNHLDACLTREEKKSSLRSSKPQGSSESKHDKLSAQPASSLASPPTSSLSSSSSSASSPKKKTLVSGSNAFIGSNKPKRKTLPQLVYNLLSDKELKQKLKQWNLSVQGNRQTLVRRHQEFVTIYNAECDSSNPKPAAVIVKEMEKRAKQKQSNKFTTASTSAGTAIHSLTRESSIEEVDKARKACLEQHGDHFQQLIHNLKMRKKRVANTNTEACSTDSKPSTSQIDIKDEDTIKQDSKECSNSKKLRKEQPILSSTSSANQTNISTDRKASNEENFQTSPSINVNKTTNLEGNRTSRKGKQSSSTSTNKDKTRISDDKIEQIPPSTSLSSRKNKISTDETMDTLTSEIPHNNQDRSTHSLVSKNDHWSDNISKQDIAMDDEEDQGGTKSVGDSQSATVVVPEPPSLSSLVFESQVIDSDDNDDDDNERVQSLDSSPSLGLASDHEMKETNNDSESDSELFRTEMARSPVKPKRSLRTRKR